MKSIFESYLLFIAFIVFLIFGLCFVQVFYQMDQARMFHYYAIAQIENFNGNTEGFKTMIEKATLCPTCQLTVTPYENQRFLIEVNYPIELSILDLVIEGELTALTIPLG